MPKTNKTKQNVGETIADDKTIEKALNDAARQAALQYKKAGLKMVGWKDGKIVDINPDEVLKPRKKTRTISGKTKSRKSKHSSYAGVGEPIVCKQK